MKKKYNSYSFIENLNNDFNYIQLNEQLSDGVIDLIIKAKDGTNVNVYSAGLWHILISDEFANEGFIDAYTKGFRNGKSFIEEKTNKALNGFYKSCSDEYINELRHAYFFKSDNYILGYKNGAYGVPTMFYIDNIESIGFASGVVCAIDLMAKESPFLFAGFYDIETNEPQQPEVYKTQNLFKVGLFFATGEMNKYFTIKNNNEMDSKNGLVSLKIAKELGNPSFEKWILASKNNYPPKNPNGNKNIFNNLDMMTKIIEHCETNNIPVEPYFTSRLPKE
ncbi:hypothetical protein [Flavobacterium psychrophilum]|uniref:hypothetical protein n=1 Tax=Flavobacterium psychrophilum TaxID=96345 RepID=UPI00106C227B|nr:hypothetical protein [Flavobacterium psychrophilum]